MQDLDLLKHSYPSYNALNRPPLVAGIPLIPLVLTAVGCLILCVINLKLGIVATFLGAIAMLALRIIAAADVQNLALIKWKIGAFLLFKGKAINGQVLAFGSTDTKTIKKNATEQAIKFTVNSKES